MADRNDLREYKRRHEMVRRARGRAADQVCVACGGPAAQWATLHDHSGLDPYDYQSMCVPCHICYDDMPAKVSASQKRRLADPAVRRRMADAKRGQKHTPEARQKMSQAGKGKQKSLDHRRKIAVALQGQKNARARLTQADALTILRRGQAGESVDVIAGDYQVTPKHARSIISGRRWSHLSLAAS